MNLYPWLAVLLAVVLGTGSSGAQGQTAVKSDFRVTLLGSGIPIPEPDRFGPATLVEAGGQKLLFDAGRGATIRLFQLRVPLREVGPLFLTHFHSDHTVGIPDVWLSGWLGGPWARRTTPFRVIGPTGTKDLMANLERAYAADIKIRMADENYPAEGIRVIAEEFPMGGVVYKKDGVRVTAFEVDHGDLIKPSYGYRIDYDGRSVVISGDTRFDKNVIKHGTGADLLIHEVAARAPRAAQGRAGAACHGPPHVAAGSGPGLPARASQARPLHAPRPAGTPGGSGRDRRGARRADPRLL